ncbi:MAG TPA: hypothetical protein VIX73_20815 [Kofleriaceae bacterium]
MSTSFSVFLIPRSLLTPSLTVLRPPWDTLQRVVLAVRPTTDVQILEAYGVNPDDLNANYLFAVYIARNDLGRLLAFIAAGGVPTPGMTSPFEATSIETGGTGTGGGGPKPLITSLASGVAHTVDVANT